MGTKLLLNYWIHGDKVEIGPNSLSHDYLCPMTIWGLIKRSHCLHDWSKKNLRWRSPRSAGTTAFIYIFVRWVYPPLAPPVQSTKLQNVFFFLRMADAHHYREGAQLGVRGFVHSSFSYCLRMSVENAPAAQTHAHTDKQPQNAHTFLATSYSKRLQ